MTTTSCLVSLAIFAVASAVPASVNKRWDSFSSGDSFESCALTCDRQSNKFSYSRDTTYIYQYSVDTETSMAGSSEDTARLSIQARAEIQALDSCDFALFLKDVRVSHSDGITGSLRPADGEEEFQKVLESSGLRFAFNDGVVSSICPDANENTWALNFKRGLLSAFQTSMENLDKNHQVLEVDVTGKCPADFTISSSWGWKKEKTVTKSKNLVSCAQRDGYKSMYQLIPYNIASEVQSLPIMKGTHQCDYVIDSNKVLKSATCSESHIYVPFSNNESGGKTKVSQKLLLMSQKTGVDISLSQVSNRATLLFDHNDGQQTGKNAAEALEQKLKEICEQTQDDIRPETPWLYSDLIQTIKTLDKAGLHQVYKKVKDQVICPQNVRALKFLLDALPMAGTEAAVSLMTSVLNSKVVDGISAKAWVASLALIQEPTSNMIDDSLKLLQGPLGSDAILPVSALINNFCQKNADCESSYNVKQVLAELKNKIPRSCNVDDRDLKEVLKALRAIGNTGQKFLTSALDECLRSTSAILELQVAAANAYRRMPCADSFDEGDSELWRILKDTSKEAELRITSYLSLMRCPDDKTLSQISQLLEVETDDHVGSFIYSHLRNLKETSDPLKQDVAKAVNLYNFKKFEQDVLKYSGNYEASVLINRLNLGFTADSNIIMNSNSPLPRSAMLNLTVDLFGNSVNLLEVGGRVEGLEILIEKLFGATGYFAGKSDNKGKDSLNDVKVSLYGRVFGNDLYFEHIKGSQALREPSKLPGIMDILLSLSKRQEVAYTFSEQLMDVALVIPTVAGLPLEISVNGSMNLDVKAEGKADLRSVASSPRSMEIEGEFRPSAALEVTGTMAVRALNTRMGLRMRNTLHSSTWLKGLISMDKGRVLNIDIQPPGDKMEIFSAKSQFFIVHNEVEKEQNMITDNYKSLKLCSGDKVATILGVELCGELKFANASAHPESPYFPLNGPSSFSVMSYRRDTHTSYKFFAMRRESKERSIARFMMDTPGSKVNRMISTDLTIVYSPEIQLDVAMASPWKKLTLNTALVTNKNLWSLVGSMVIDEKDKYGLTTEVKMSSKDNVMSLSPLVSLTQRGRTESLLSGQVNIDLASYSMFDAKLEFQSFGMTPYTYEGAVINQAKERRVRMGLSQLGKNLYLFNVGSTMDWSGKDGRSLKVTPALIVEAQGQTLFSLTGWNDYKADKALNGEVTLELYRMKASSLTWRIAQSKSSRQQNNYNVDLKLKSSLLTGTVDGDVSQQKNLYSSKIKVNYNMPRFGTDLIVWTSKLKNDSKNTYLKYSLSSNLDMKKLSDYNLGLQLDVDYKKKQSDVDLQLRYGANPKDDKKLVRVKSSFSGDIQDRQNVDVAFKLQAQAPEKNVNFNMDTKHIHSPKSLDSSISLKFTPALKDTLGAAISLQDRSTKLMNYEGKINLNMAGRKFEVNNELTQKAAKHFQNSLRVNDFNGAQHTVSTVYRLPSSNGHEVNADININGYRPVQLQGKTVLDLQNFQAFGSAAYGSEVYNVSALSKLTDAAKRVNFELMYPDRQIQAEAELKNTKDKVSGNVIVDWNAKKNDKSKVILEGLYRNSAEADFNTINGAVSIKTPFASLEDWSADATYMSEPSHYSTKGKISWGNKKDTISSSVVIKNPISLQNADVTFSATTPFRDYRSIDLEINHRVDPTFMSSIKGKLDDSEAQVVIKGENRGDYYRRNLIGSVEMKTPIPELQSVIASLEYNDDGRQYKTKGSFEVNNKKFGADLQMDHRSNDYSVTNNGDFTVSWPGDRLQTNWKHSTQGFQQIKCSLDSSWSGNRKILFSLDGSNDLSNDIRRIQGTLNVRTPLQSYKEILFKLENSLGNNKLESSASLYNSRVEKMVYNVLLEQTPEMGTAQFLLKTPFYEHKIQGQTAVSWDANPYTTSAWFEWAPWARVNFDGSLNAPSVNDIALNAKLTTPFKNFENVIAGASHKLENSEFVSHATLNYGVRRMLELENRLRYDDDVKLLRTKISTPYAQFKSFNTGYLVKTSQSNYEAGADFELQPFVNKYDGFVTWNYNTANWNGKLRLNTPHKELPSLQIVTFSKKNPDSRLSRIEIEPSPYGMYSLESSYRVASPFQLDVNLKTPHPNYDGLSLTAMYSPSETAVQSRFRLVYQPNQEIDSLLKLDWRNNFEGSFQLNTPFAGFESSKVLARHDLISSGYTSHGEVHVGRKSVIGDVTLTYSSAETSGNFILTTPIYGYEKLSGNLNLKGAINKLRGNVTLNIGANAYSSSFINNAGLGYLNSNIALTTPYTQDLKVSVQHKDSSSYYETKLECGAEAQYGADKSSGTLSLSYTGLDSAKIDLSLTTPYKSTLLNIQGDLTSDSVSVKTVVQSDAYSVGTLEVNLVKNGSYNDMDETLSIFRNGESLLEIVSETNLSGEVYNGKVSLGGRWLPLLTAELDHKGGIYDFTTKAKMSGKNGNIFDDEFTFKFEDSELNAENKISYVYGSVSHTYTASFESEGTLADFKVELSQKFDDREMSMTATFQAQDSIKGSLLVNNLSARFDKVGVEFEHTGDLEKFLTTGKLFTSSSQQFSGKVNFYRYNFQRIEASAELSTPFRDYRFSSIEYRHESGNGRHSCRLNALYGNNQNINLELVVQCSPSAHSLNFNLKTPFRGYQDIILSGSFDNSQAQGKAVLGQGLVFTIDGQHEVSDYPYNVQYRITTPLEILKSASLDLKGRPLDGSVGVGVESFQKKVDTSVALQYENLYDMSLLTKLTSDIDYLELLQLEIRNEKDEVKGLSSHMAVAWDPSQQVTVDGRYSTAAGRWSSNKGYNYELEISTPFEPLKTAEAKVQYSAEANNLQTIFSMAVNQNKLVDATLSYDKSSKNKYSALINKPWPMEYSLSLQNDNYVQEREVYVNWDRDEPTSNVRITTSMTSQVAENARSVAITYVSSYRTMGVEHKLSTLRNKYSNSGKVYWSDDDDSRFSYSLDIGSVSRRRDTTYTGDLKLGFPTRTFGVAGSLSNSELIKRADAAFSWDLDRDDSKRLEMQVTLSGQEYTKADISLKLPAQNLQVQSAVILNQGNTIFDGKTDISYTSEARKTLTLFSKLKNTPVSYGYFSNSGDSYNYSVELGVQHPETKVDVRIDSHVASSSDYLTTSFGVRYMTALRQTKNLALFAEIDKIKKQMNLVATGPSSKAGISGSVSLDDPLTLSLQGSVNGQERFRSSLDVNRDNKYLKFDFGQPTNFLSFKTFYPNRSAIQAELFHKNEVSDHQETVLGLRLLNPRLLHSRLHWNPQAFDELRNFVAQQITATGQLARETLQGANQEVQTELTSKYNDITSSLASDLTPLLNYLGDEFESFAEDAEAASQRLSKMRQNNEFFLNDIIAFAYANFDYASQAYTYVQDKYQLGLELYRETYKNWLQTVQDRIQQVQEFSFSDAYNQVVSYGVRRLLQALDNAVVAILSPLRSADLRILEKSQAILSNLGDLYNHPRLDFIRERINKVKNLDYTSMLVGYYSTAKSSISNLDWKPYKEALYSVTDSAVNTIIPEGVKDLAERTSNEIYQQTKNAYKYWDVEANLYKHLNLSVELLKEVVEEEIREYFNLLVIRSPVTVYDPVTGDMEANLILPVAVTYLDEMPDFSQLAQQTSNLYETYKPVASKVQQYWSRYWPTIYKDNTTEGLDNNTEDDIISNLDNFVPSRMKQDPYVYKS